MNMNLQLKQNCKQFGNVHVDKIKSPYTTKKLKYAMKTDDGSSTIKEHTFLEVVEMAKQDSKEFGYYMSRAFIHWPDDKNNVLPQFLDRFLVLLQSQYSGYVIERCDNACSLAAIFGKQLLANGKLEDVAVNQVGDNTTFLCSHNDDSIFNISFRLIGSSVELARMFISETHRNNGFGTYLVESARDIARSMNVRLLLFPCPPLAEVKSKKMNNDQRDLACERLVCYYAKRDFVKCLPEYIPVLRISGMKSTHIGLHGFMSSI
jgi:GNAT superfamily N-acetyltransferase